MKRHAKAKTHANAAQQVSSFQKMTFGTTLYKSYAPSFFFYFKTILNILQKDINWVWASSFEKTNKKNFKCFGLCPFLILMKSLFACWDDPSSLSWPSNVFSP